MLPGTDNYFAMMKLSVLEKEYANG
jgi:hypothetical protein